MMKKITGVIVALCIATPAIAQVETPSQLYGPLFEDVQMKHVFPDGKTFVDAVANDHRPRSWSGGARKAASPASTCRPSFDATSPSRIRKTADTTRCRARTC